MTLYSLASLKLQHLHIYVYVIICALLLTSVLLTSFISMYLHLSLSLLFPPHLCSSPSPSLSSSLPSSFLPFLPPSFSPSHLFQHKFHTVTNRRLQSVSQCSDTQSLFNSDLPQILKERVPDTAGHAEVKEVCVSLLFPLWYYYAGSESPNIFVVLLSNSS